MAESNSTLDPEQIARLLQLIEPPGLPNAARDVTWSERLLSWRHQGITVNVLVYSVLACLLQRVLGNCSQEQIIGAITDIASSLGYASPAALCVGAYSAFRAGRSQ